MSEIKNIHSFLKGAFQSDYHPEMFRGTDIADAFLDEFAKSMGVRTTDLFYMNGNKTLRLHMKLRDRYVYAGGKSIPIKVSFDFDITKSLDFDLLFKGELFFYSKNIKNLVFRVDGNEKEIQKDLVKNPLVERLYENAPILNRILDENLEMRTVSFAGTGFSDPNEAIRGIEDAIALYQLGVPQDDGKSMIERIHDEIIENLTEKKYLASPSGMRIYDVKLVKSAPNHIYLSMFFRGAGEYTKPKNKIPITAVPLPNGGCIELNDNLKIGIEVVRPPFKPADSLPEYRILNDNDALIGKYYPEGTVL